MADQMVLKSQQWLNKIYGGRDGYGNNIAEDGYTGWGTINALIRALQLELGITNTANNFGPSTIAKFNARFPNGIQQQAENDQSEDNIYAIIQCACWCKGYSTYEYDITKHFYWRVGEAIKELKGDAGCSDTTSTVTLNIMKALLSMDQFKLISSGQSKVREIQQKLNKKYEDYIGLIPCDGIYGRQMNEAFIKALQKIEGYSKEQATGNFGDGTKSNLPIVPSAGQINAQTEKDAIELVRYALCCNGYTSVNINSNQWDTSLGDIVEEFQGDMFLDKIRICDTNTWMALLLSKGNPDRPYNAIDTAYTIYSQIAEPKRDRIEILKNNGINLVGRYISGNEGKQLKEDEAPTMLAHGINFYPIFQEDVEPSVSYFTVEQAEKDAKTAYSRAKNYCIPEDTIIYFAVDIDMLDSQITNYVLPYFDTLKNNLQKYRIGVYGTRNVCSRVMEKKYAVTCLVSDASVGYSGNMGFKMPTNWNIDQFATDVPLGDFFIDKNIFSNRFPVVTELAKRDYYSGEVEVKGTNNGRGYFYAGRKLKLNVTALGVDGKPIDDLYVLVRVTTESVQYPDNVCTDGVVIAKVDGNTYDLKTEELYDTDGNRIYRESIFISEQVKYYLKYSICKKTSDGKYILEPDKVAKVKIELSTFPI